MIVKVAVWMVTLCSGCWTFCQSTPNAPAAPPARVKLDPWAYWRDATVALGHLVQGKFIVDGTAIIVAVDNSHGVLLTARHMLFGPNGLPVPQLWMRRASKHGETVPPILLNDTLGKLVWRELPNNDLAIIPFQQRGNLRARLCQHFDPRIS